jgi:hypothetical protein
MSESVSTATKTINTNLTSENFLSSEFGGWLSFNLKILFTLFVVYLISSSIMSSMMPMTATVSRDDNIMFVPPHMKGCQCGKCPKTCPCNKCKRLLMEEFSNDELYSYSKSQYADYQSIPLLAKNDEFNNPENLLFGQASRHIYIKDDIMIVNFEIFCNLFVLDGSVYGESKKVDQKYKVYLLNDKTKSKMFLSDLNKDGDGIYKLKIKSKDVETLVKYNVIHIVYSLDNKEEVVLKGEFK